MKNEINNNILSLIKKTPDVFMQDIADKIRQRRLEKSFTQQGLSRKAGVSFSSYRRFENTGEISLRSLVMVAFALDLTQDIEQLFANPRFEQMDQLLVANENRQRKRGTRHE